MPNTVRIWAHGGDAVCAPENTLVAYWAALGGGADGLVVPVQLTADGRAVCVRDLAASTGASEGVGDLRWREVRAVDAGSRYQRPYLDEQHQPTGEVGGDTPWVGHNKFDALYHPELAEVLRLFGRRTSLMLWLQAGDAQGGEALVDGVVESVNGFGLGDRIVFAGSADVVGLVRQRAEGCRVALVVEEPGSVAGIEPDFLIVPAAKLAGVAAGGGPGLLAYCEPAPSPEAYATLTGGAVVAGFVVSGVLETAGLRSPAGLVASDDFGGDDIDRGLWVVGQSKDNEDTEYGQQDGKFTIEIREGGDYSGAALLTAYPIHGDFDARVSFTVANPQQGTTFELAAIEVDPGYYGKINLTFDVHGAPPYASSERDENDGFRMGWNNGPGLIKNVQVGEKPWDTEAQSDNAYNKYSRDVGDGSAENPSGRLRLVRRGDVFAAYYIDGHNRDWVLSGTALVPTLATDVFLRLGAKHWRKRGKTPPYNKIEFSKFRLYQN